MYDLLLFLHVLSAFALMSGVICSVPYLMLRMDGPAVERAFKVGGILAAVGGMGTLILGLLLIWDAEYEFFTLWVIGALVLWAIGTGAGERAGRSEDREKGSKLLAVAGAATVVILILMIWKPGA